MFEIQINNLWNSRETEGDLTQTYDKNRYTNGKFEIQWTTQKRHQKHRLYNDFGPTKDGQFEWQQSSNWCVGA